MSLSTCSSIRKDRIVAEYALHGMTKPIGVSEYKPPNSIPKNLLSSLPTPEELEKEMRKKRTGA